MPTAAEWNALCEMAERAFNMTSDPSTGVEAVRSGGPLSLRLPPKPVEVVEADASSPDATTPGYFDGSVVLYDPTTGLPTERQKCWIKVAESITGPPGPPGGTVQLDGFDVSLSTISIPGVNDIFFGSGTTAANYPLYLQDFGGGQAEVFAWDATPSQSGIVNNTAGTGGAAGNPQDFGGNKRFVRHGGAGSPIKGIIVSAYGTGSPFTSDTWVQVIGGNPCFDATNNVTTANSTTLRSDGIYFRLVGGSVGGTIVGLVGGARVNMAHGGSSDTVDFVWDAGSSQFVVQAGSTNDITAFMCGTHVGLTGTITPGALFHGGIVYSLPTKPTITGSRGGNAALASLLSALNSGNFILDSSTP